MTANKMYHFQSSASGALHYIQTPDGKEVKLDFSNGHCAVVLSPEEFEAAKKHKSYGKAFALQGELKNPASGHQVQVIVAKGAAPSAPDTSTPEETDLSEAEEIREQQAETARIQQALAQQEADAKVQEAANRGKGKSGKNR